MTSDQPVPPSVPPRDRAAEPDVPGPAGGAPSPTARPDAGTPRAASVPNPATTGVAEPRSAAEAPGAGAAARARAAAAGGVAAAAARRAVRSATTAVTGTAPGSSGAPTAHHDPGTGGQPRASEPKDPTITDTATRPSRPGPSPSSSAAPPRDGAPRRVRLSLSRVDPWSVMKLSFLLSFAIGVMIVVAAAVIWLVLDSMAVFTTANDVVTEVVGEESPIDILSFVDFSRVVSGAAVIAIVDVVLLTALSTLGAFLYNITAALVGGVNVTLTDE